MNMKKNCFWQDTVTISGKLLFTFGYQISFCFFWIIPHWDLNDTMYFPKKKKCEGFCICSQMIWLFDKLNADLVLLPSAWQNL